MLSVVIPSYNEQGNVAAAAARARRVLSDAGIAHEIIFVDDGSADGTWEEILRMTGEGVSPCAEDAGASCTAAGAAGSTVVSSVRGIRFSRNFGKEAAIMAGLGEARGDCCAVIDCDLQMPPEKLPDMYRLWQEGVEVVEGVKRTRGRESALNRFGARLFYRIISDATGTDMSRASDFKLLDRRAVDVLVRMEERSSFFRALSSWIGFRTAQVEFEVGERASGTSKWGIRKLTRYAASNIASFTTLPMQIVTVLGFLMLIVTALQGIEALYRYISGQALGGFTTVILLQLFTGSIVMISLGIIGYYLARIYEEIKGRPRFIIAERTEQAAAAGTGTDGTPARGGCAE